MKLSILFVFSSVLCLLIGVECLSYSSSLQTPTFAFSRMKGKGTLKNKFTSYTSNKLKFSNMALSFEKIRENNQLWQKISKDLQDESEESPKQNLFSQIKSITKLQRLIKELLKNTEILEQAAKTKELQASYKEESFILRNNLQNLNQTKQELKKLLSQLSTPEVNTTSDEIKKAQEEIQAAKLVVEQLEKQKKEKENEYLKEFARFLAENKKEKDDDDDEGKKRWNRGKKDDEDEGKKRWNRGKKDDDDDDDDDDDSTRRPTRTSTPTSTRRPTRTFSTEIYPTQTFSTRSSTRTFSTTIYSTRTFPTRPPTRTFSTRPPTRTSSTTIASSTPTPTPSSTGENTDPRTINGLIEAIYLAKSTFFAFLLNLGSEYCLKEDFDFRPPTHCPNNFERETINSISFCKERCPDYYSLCESICYEDCTNVCIRNGGFNKGHSYRTILGGLRCQCRNENNIYTRRIRFISHIYNHDSRVFCTNAPYTYKFGSKCYKGCYQYGLKDCSISLCGSNCESGSADFNKEIFEKVERGIRAGLIVAENDASFISKDFNDFLDLKKKFTTIASTTAFNSVKLLIQEFKNQNKKDDWIKKFEYSAKVEMPGYYKKSFDDNDYKSISESMIQYLEERFTANARIKVLERINFDIVARNIPECKLQLHCHYHHHEHPANLHKFKKVSNTEHSKKLECAKLILKRVIQTISLDFILIQRTYGSMLCKKKIYTDDVYWATGGKILTNRKDNAITISSEEQLPEFFEVNIKLVKMEYNDIVIGLSKKKYNDPSINAAGNWLAHLVNGEYGYDAKRTGYKYSYPGKQEFYGESCLEGDTLTIAYKKDKTISFYRNKKNMGIAFTNVNGPFYLAATVFTQKTKLEIVSCHILE